MSASRQQVTRMLALVPYLQGHEGIPVNDVATEFGVTAKQIRDDLRLLMYTGTGEYAGQLIDFDLGALDEDGVVSIRDAEFMTRPLRITGREGAALIVALRTLRASTGPAQRDIIDSALAKLEAAVGESAQTPVDVHLDAVDPTIHATLVEGLSASRRLHITYATASRDERSERDVDPRRIFTEHGTLYLEAWCLKAEDLRFFRLDRVIDATVTDVPAEEHDAPPRDLSDGFFSVGENTPHAVVDLHRRARWLSDYYPVDIIEEYDDGGCRARVYGPDLAWLQRLVLRNAGTVAAIEPLELAAEVRHQASVALTAYDES